MTAEKPVFEQWAIVELFGHQRIAGLVSEQTIGGCAFVRVDVPEVKGEQAWTKLFGNGAIYAIGFVDEDLARIEAARLRVRPIDHYSLRDALAAAGKTITALPVSGSVSDDPLAPEHIEDDSLSPV